MESLENMVEAMDWYIYIVITDHNGWHKTKICLDTLSGALGDRVQVVLVSHGTTEHTAKNSNHYQNVNVLIESPELWWTGATNRGIEYALQRGATHCVLLNNDSYLRRGDLELLVSCYFNEEIEATSIVAPVQRDAKSKAEFPYRIRTLLALGFTTVEERGHNVHSCETLCPVKLIQGGRGVFIPKPTITMVGMLDELNFPHYLADHDYYLRCQTLGIPMLIKLNANVEVDSESTTLSSGYIRMAFSDFVKTITDKKSHKNFNDVSKFYRKHSRNRLTLLTGLSLFYLRHCMFFLWLRTLHLFNRKKTSR